MGLGVSPVLFLQTQLCTSLWNWWTFKKHPTVMQNFKSMLVKMSNLELCCDYYLRTFMFYSTHFGNKLHVLSFLFLAFVLFFTPFLLMIRNCWCYRNKAKRFAKQQRSNVIASLRLLLFLALRAKWLPERKELRRWVVNSGGTAVKMILAPSNL